MSYRGRKIDLEKWTAIQDAFDEKSGRTFIHIDSNMRRGINRIEKVCNADHTFDIGFYTTNRSHVLPFEKECVHLEVLKILKAEVEGLLEVIEKKQRKEEKETGKSVRWWRGVC